MMPVLIIISLMLYYIYIFVQMSGNRCNFVFIPTVSKSFAQNNLEVVCPNFLKQENFSYLPNAKFLLLILTY